MTYYARQASHINEDIQRGWSSWNFGAFGFEGTREELEDAMEDAISNETAFEISGFELWGDDIRKADIRELYSGYWVLVDTRFIGALAGCELEAESLEEAISEIPDTDFWGDGVRIALSSCKLVYTSPCGEYHIFAEEA